MIVVLGTLYIFTARRILKYGVNRIVLTARRTRFSERWLDIVVVEKTRLEVRWSCWWEKWTGRWGGRVDGGPRYNIDTRDEEARDG